MKVVTLGDISAFITKGATPTTYGFKWELSGVPFLRSECVSENGLDMRQSMFISPEANAVLSRSQVVDGDILITITGNVGRVIRLDGIGAANINQHIARIRVSDPRFDKGFVYHYLSQVSVREYYQTITTGQAYPQISLAQVRDTEIPNVALPEQTAISSALDCADVLIASLERLLAKKRDIKQGMMRELLTGRVRLPGFADPWRELLVSEVLEFKNGLNKASQYFGHGTPIVNFMDVMRAPVITAERVNGLVSLGREEIGRFSARRGDMFFTRTSESVEEIGTAAVLVDDISNAVFSGFVLRGRPIARVNTTFLAYQFQLSSVRKQVVSTASYTTRALTNGGSLGRVRVLVPSADEQATIVEVIADVDAEIALLERRLKSARDVKTGVMQELLTGRTRLPVGAAL